MFESALALFRIYVGGEQMRDIFQDPHWPMWYLSALFFWRLGTPVFKAMPALLALPVAVAVSRALGVTDTPGVLLRFALLAVGTLGALAFVALTPRNRGWFTRMGAATLVVYLFHGFVIKGADYAGYTSWADDHRAVAFGLTTVLAAALAMFLAWPPVARVLSHA